MTPIQNERGERLVAIHHASGHDVVTKEAVVFALMLAEGPEGMLLVFNTRRQIRELPGGWVDEGETAAEAAVRELREESGRTVADVRCLALLELECPPQAGEPEPRTLRGALFHGRLTETRMPDDGGQSGPASAPDVEARETVGVAFWTGDNDEGEVSAIDLALLQRFSSRLYG